MQNITKPFAACAVLVFASLFAAPARAGAVGAVDVALLRELSLLDAEAHALTQQRDDAVARHEREATALRAEVARLEAAVATAAGEEADLQATLSAVGVPGDRTSSVNVDGALLAARDALAARGITVAAKGRAALVQGLMPSITSLRERSAPRRIEGGFFDEDGAFMSGVVVALGPLGVAASRSSTSSDATVAGALRPADGGAPLQLATDARVDVEAAALARSLAHTGRAEAIPLWFGPVADDAASVPVLTTRERLGRLGVGAWCVLSGVVASLLLGLARVVVLVRGVRDARVLLSRVPALVQARELGAALALCRGVGGAPGRLFLEATEAAAHADDEELEGCAGAAFVRESERLDRGHIALVAGALLVTVGACAVATSTAAAVLQDAGRTNPDAQTVVNGLADAVWIGAPVALAVLVLVVVGAVGAALAGALKGLLEQGALRVVDAAVRARR